MICEECYLEVYNTPVVCSDCGQRVHEVCSEWVQGSSVCHRCIRKLEEEE